MITGLMRPSRMPCSSSRRTYPRRSPPGADGPDGLVGTDDGWPDGMGICCGLADGAGGALRPKICPRMSPSPPDVPDGAAGALGAAVPDFEPINPEITIPASTGSICLRMSELTPESC